MKRFFAAAMALAMTAGLLSGCGNQTAGNSQGDTAQANNATTLSDTSSAVKAPKYVFCSAIRN